MYHALIMAGGTGTRLWPLSRRQRPKQSLSLIGERTLFQASVERLEPLFSPECIHVVTRREYVPQLREQVPRLPAANFVVEPEGRGTAPAIALGAIHLMQRDPEAVMAVLTADQHVADTERFRAALAAAAQVAAENRLVTLGIRPTAPITGYGYIQQGQALAHMHGFPVFRVRRFTEKPEREAAERMLRSGDYAWNAGMFIWRVSRILEQLKRHMPTLHGQLMSLRHSLGSAASREELERLWPQVERETIDYGVMEKAQDIVVIPVDMGWSDVGSWSSLMDLLDKDAAGNAVIGRHLSVDTQGCLIHSDKRTIATIGVRDLVIVETDDAVLVCPREREQEVRQLVQRLEDEGPATLL